MRSVIRCRSRATSQKPLCYQRITLGRGEDRRGSVRLQLIFGGEITKAEAGISGIADMGLCQAHQSV